MDLQTMYASMDVSHLSVDEVEYELLIRNILFHFDEHESIKRRKLKDRLKSEKESKTFSFSQPWRNVDEELVTISSKLKVIGGLLENPKTDARQRQKLKTRLVHYRVRNYILSKAKGADNFRDEIEKVGRHATELFRRFYPEVHGADVHSKDSEQLESDLNDALEEVKTEIEILNESTVTGKEIEDQLEQTETANHTLELKKKEMNESVKRSEEILKVLAEYEEGKKENPLELIAVFKSFVQQTTEQQKQMREKQIAEEEKRLREAREAVERRKRLEKVLISLNDRLKKEPESVEKTAVKCSVQENRGLGDEKVGEKRISFHHDSDGYKAYSKQDSSEDSRESTEFKSKKEKNTFKKGCRTFKRENQRRRKASYSSTSSTTSETESFEYNSSESRSDSSTDRAKRRGRRESRRNWDLKRMPVAEWRLKYDGKDQGRKLTEFLKESTSQPEHPSGFRSRPRDPDRREEPSDIQDVWWTLQDIDIPSAAIAQPPFVGIRELEERSARPRNPNSPQQPPGQSSSAPFPAGRNVPHSTPRHYTHQ
ncbi:AAEL009494-PA [Aedes aegypti]|uniref:AAEL009494-PA n=1 Tax=Aedes aegypti TaxID=7159 RepID=Q16VM7_AEDAE|nr:AAEL009494-PA [Aedes aegypti]